MNQPVPDVAVASPSFSRNPALRQEMLELFPKARFCPSSHPLQGEELADFLRTCEAAVIGTEKMTRRVLEARPKPRFIAKYGVGMDNIDLKLLEEFGIELGESPGTNCLSVAEMALAYALGLMHNLFFTGQLLKQNVWKKDGGRILTGHRIGIWGAGHVGSELMRLLEPFSCEILFCDLLKKPELEKRFGARQVSFEELLEKSEILSLHVPLSPLSRMQFGAEVLSRMPKGAYLINTARSEILDFEALIASLREGHLGGACLDVWPDEPRMDLGQYADLPLLFGTPHIAGNSREAVLNMGRGALNHLRRAFSI